VYGVIYSTGKCKGPGTLVQAGSLEECAIFCDAQVGCQFLSYSDSGACKLTASCDSVGQDRSYSVYQIGATPAPTASPTPLTWGIYANPGKCKGTGTVHNSGIGVEACAQECLQLQSSSGCQFFSHSSTECKLSATCDEIGTFATEFTVYQMFWTMAPTFAPGVPTPAPTPVTYGIHADTGKCKGTGTVDTSGLTVEQCGSMCAQTSGCQFFSHSSTECKLSDTCNEIGTFATGFTVYHLALTLAPTFAPGVPTPSPTPLSYTLEHATGMCKGTPLNGSPFPIVADLQECGRACLAQSGCMYFSFASASGECKLTSTCDRNKWATAFAAYQLG
jgi:hypothetical protein